MAHFAELDSNNKVIRVIVVHNNELLDENGVEVEQNGINFCQRLLGGRWVQTSYNGNFRDCFAGAGMIYDADQDIFRAPTEEELNPPIVITVDNDTSNDSEFVITSNDSDNDIVLLDNDTSNDSEAP